MAFVSWLRAAPLLSNLNFDQPATISAVQIASSGEGRHYWEQLILAVSMPPFLKNQSTLKEFERLRHLDRRSGMGRVNGAPLPPAKRGAALAAVANGTWVHSEFSPAAWRRRPTAAPAPSSRTWMWMATARRSHARRTRSSTSLRSTGQS